MDYHIKYIKYKKKYHELKKLYGGLNKLDFEEGINKKIIKISRYIFFF